MGIFNQNDIQKIAISSFVTAFMAAALLFAGLMVWRSSQLRGDTLVARTETVAIGPLQLSRLTKTPLQTGGYAASIQLLPGLWLYGGIWVTIADAIVMARLASADPYWAMGR